MNEYEILERIEQIYQDRRWMYQENDPGSLDREIFDRLVRFVLSTPGKYVGIVISMIENFLISRHCRPYAQSYWRMIDRLCKENKRVIVMPVLPVEKKAEDGVNKEGKTKSGPAALYELMTTRSSKDVPQNLLERRNPFNPGVKFNQGDHIVFVDDFVASGNQFAEMLKVVRAQFGECPVSLFSCVIQEFGRSHITDLGVTVHAQDVRAKAISDGFGLNGEDLGAAMEIYLEFEKTLKVPNGYSLGDRQMEALVSMKRTPNSTLPIFWCQTTHGGDPWPAPFVR